MSKFIKENRNMLLSFLILVILFPIIILTPSPIGIISKDIGLQIVGYGGSILGGFLTLYGVWWTIKKQEEQRREDLSIQYKPYLLVIPESEKNVVLIYSHIDNYYENISGIYAININPDTADYCYTVELIIENIGEGECFLECNNNVKVTGISNKYYTLTNNDFEYSTYLTQDIMIKSKWKDIIPRKNKIKLLFQILYDFESIKDNTIINIEIPLIYNDQFKKSKYNSHLTIQVVIDNNDNSKHLKLSMFNIDNDKIK